MVHQHAFVVLAYGRSPFLADCLASLRGQDGLDHLLVTTSTPNDQISAVAKAYDASLIVNPRREGIAGDWNFGLRASRSRFVTLAHQDDVYRSGFLEASLRELERSGRSICFTGYDEVDDNGSRTASKISRVQHLIEIATLGGSSRPSGWRMRAFLAFGNPLPCSSVTFDRERLQDFAFSPDYDSNLDWDAWLRLLNSGYAFARAPERLVGRRRNLHTATSTLIADGRRQSEDLKMFRRIWPRAIADLIAHAYRTGY